MYTLAFDCQRGDGAQVASPVPSLPWLNLNLTQNAYLQPENLSLFLSPSKSLRI